MNYSEELICQEPNSGREGVCCGANGYRSQGVALFYRSITDILCALQSGSGIWGLKSSLVAVVI